MTAKRGTRVNLYGTASVLYSYNSRKTSFTEAYTEIRMRELGTSQAMLYRISCLGFT